MVFKIEDEEQKQKIARQVLVGLPECFLMLWDSWNPCQIYIIDIEK